MGVGAIDSIGDAQLAAFHSVELMSEVGERFAWSRSPDAPAVMIVNWGSWCGACLGELPHLARLQAQMGSKLRVLLLSMPEHWDADRAYVHAHGLPFALYVPHFANQEERLAVRFSRTRPDGTIVTAFPVTTLWTGDGRFVRGTIGSMDWQDADVATVAAK